MEIENDDLRQMLDRGRERDARAEHECLAPDEDAPRAAKQEGLPL